MKQDSSMNKHPLEEFESLLNQVRIGSILIYNVNTFVQNKLELKIIYHLHCIMCTVSTAVSKIYNCVRGTSSLKIMPKGQNSITGMSIVLCLDLWKSWNSRFF